MVYKDRITELTIARLAEAIPGTKMEMIAETYFGIQNARVKHTQEENIGNILGFNREIIRMWANRQIDGSRTVSVS